jgi:hypothetical protein
LIRLRLGVFRHRVESAVYLGPSVREAGGSDVRVWVEVESADRLVIEEEGLKIAEDKSAVTLGASTGSASQTMDVWRSA